MSALRRGTAAIVVASLVFSGTRVAHAQTVPATPASSVEAGQSNDTMAAGLLDGETLAESQRTGGNLGAGLGVGVLTGLIGTGIGYFVVGPSPLSADAAQRSAGKSADYQLGLKTGWEKKTKSKKRNAFLAGGLLGTAVWIAIYSAAGSGE
jgi:hypothetical protein